MISMRCQSLQHANNQDASSAYPCLLDIVTDAGVLDSKTEGATLPINYSQNRSTNPGGPLSDGHKTFLVGVKSKSPRGNLLRPFSTAECRVQIQSATQPSFLDFYLFLTFI